MTNYSISIYLDTRKKKANGNYPLKLQVYTPNPKKQKFYSTKFEMTKKEYNSILCTDKPRLMYKEIKTEIEALTTRADEVAKELKPFTFEIFEKKFFRKIDEGCKVVYQYNEYINQLTKNGQIGTAQSYKDSLRSLEVFHKSNNKGSFEDVTFYQITKDWLNSYESYMVNYLNRSNTTVGIYIRPLRAIYKIAIREREIEEDYYPFGVGLYQIPTSERKKKALTPEQLKRLYQAQPHTTAQEKAKDFWFFSFNCSGINIKDIVQLKYKDLENDKFDFVRAKTKRTTKTKQQKITVYLNDFSKAIIAKYGNEDKSPNNYVFDVLDDRLNPVDANKKIKNFTRFINQNINRICEANELPHISTYWARHSYATISINKGATMEFMRESLGHGDMKTTLSYFAGFDNETKKEFANNLMDFE